VRSAWKNPSTRIILRNASAATRAEHLAIESRGNHCRGIGRRYALDVLLDQQRSLVHCGYTFGMTMCGSPSKFFAKRSMLRVSVAKSASRSSACANCLAISTGW
jgi:hypothetical protein